MHFSGLQIVPAPLVPVVRGLLASQGVTNPGAVTDSGELDPMALIALGFDRVEIRTALSPPVVINLGGPSDPQTEATLKRVQPAIMFSGRAGKAEIAPYGVPLAIDPDIKNAGVSIGLGLGAALLGVMLFGGAIFGKRGTP